MNVRGSIVHNSPKVEMTHMLINWQTEKQKVGEPDNGILFSYTKAWMHQQAATWMNLENTVQSKRR